MTAARVRWPELWTLACLAALGVHALRHRVPMVVFDQWAVLPLVRRAVEGGDALGVLAELFHPHVSHCHATGQGLLVLLGLTTGLEPVAQVLSILAVAAVYVVLFQRVLATTAVRLGVPAAAPWVRALTAPVLLAPDQGLNWVWGWQLSVHCALLGVAVWLAALSADGPLTPRRLAVAAAGAACAVASSSTGFLLGPLGLAWILVHPERGPRLRTVAAGLWSTAFVAAATAFVLALDPAAAAPTAASGAEARVGVVGSAVFASTVLGAGVARQEASVVAWIAPAAAVLVLVGAALPSRRTPRLALAPLLALAVFAVGAACMTAAGRAGLGPSQARVFRYVAFSNPFWLAVLVPVLVHAVHTRRPVLRAGALAFVLLCLLGKAGGSAAAVERMHAFSAQVDRARTHVVEALASGRPAASLTDAELAPLGVPSQFPAIRDHLAWLHARGWPPFGRRR